MQPQVQNPYPAPQTTQPVQPQMQAPLQGPQALPALQEILNRITQVNNILITVKANPSVDELAAALGLTIALDHSGKHSTVVFSGKVPDVMSFLNPEKIIEKDVHSLRDFIISLNKDKADKLRFAKDGEIVKIYITPYKSTITSKDLGYGEGDFNVELVLAIGINNKEELDSVIAAHGRILHDATVTTITPGSEISQLGSINWSDLNYSSASAMALTLLQNLNLPSGISPEVATALLTGLVADTDRFSNAKTTPLVMELAAQLMSAGANHQLVTSSIGNLTTQNPNQSNFQNNQNQLGTDVQTTPEDLTLELHQNGSTVTATTGQAIDQLPQEGRAPRVAPPPPRVATNIAPMSFSNSANPNPGKVQTSSSNLGQSPTQVDIPAPQSLGSPAPQPEKQSDQVTGLAATTTTPFSDANQDGYGLAPQPLGSLPVSSSEPPKEAEADRIQEEIDAIYNAQPFDPANNPRQDYGTDLILPSEPNMNPTTNSQAQVDTSVQQDQHQESKFNSIKPPELKPIQSTREEVTNSDELPGNSPIPGLEFPPEIMPPPPPPPPPGAATTEAKPTSYPVDSFGNQINFNPTKNPTS